MLEKFNTFIRSHKLVTPDDKILLAVSGGVDSIVMLDLCSKMNNPIAIIHCNFSLRGDESDEDERFVRQLGSQYNIPIYAKRFNTHVYAAEHNISIQMAARELRYTWFEEIREVNGFTSIATAHNKNDMVETFFINLSRGTGIKGLAGINPKSGTLIRPLLFANREEIESYCKEHQLVYREDSSNQLVKYKRNKIRHQIIPIFQEINPDFISTMFDNIVRLKDVEDIFSRSIAELKKDIVIFKDNEIWIEIGPLKNIDCPKAFLFEILLPYRFPAEIIPSVYASLYGQPGKTFLSPTHRLVRDRNFLIINPRKAKSLQNFQVLIDDEIILYPIELKLKRGETPPDFSIPADNTIACLDEEKLSYPLLLRKWNAGDFFCPLGMEHKKKLSDFFIDQKIPLHEKENIWLLESNGEIAWVIGYRIDNRFKITSQTKKMIIINLIGDK